MLLCSPPRLSGVGRQVRTHTQFGKPWVGKREVAAANPMIHGDDAAASKEKRLCEVLQYKYPTWNAVAEKSLGGAAAMLTPLNLLLPRH